MATIEELNANAASIVAGLNSANTALDTIDTTLDTVLTLIQELRAGVPVTQQQIDALNGVLLGAKTSAETAQTHAEAILTEANALDD